MSSNYSSVKSNSLNVNKLTALWGFSEAALGGILHALRIPFTGLFVGGAAVFFISLIAQYSNSKSQILKSTLIVILVKVVVTPFVPFTSYFAVFVQGIIGYLLFRFIRVKSIATFLFGIFALSLSAFQKIIILTILFGNGFWVAIDSFMKFLVMQFSLPKNFMNFSISLILISVYTLLHISAGIYVSIKVLNFEKWFAKKKKELNINVFSFTDDSDYFEKKKVGKKKHWWQKKSGIAILTISFFIMIISYKYPQLGKNLAYEILFMLVRSFLITFIWFEIISPRLAKYLKSFFDKKKFEHASEVNAITSLFPEFKRVINYTWSISKNMKGVARISHFLSSTIALLFLLEANEE